MKAPGQAEAPGSLDAPEASGGYGARGDRRGGHANVVPVSLASARQPGPERDLEPVLLRPEPSRPSTTRPGAADPGTAERGAPDGGAAEPGASRTGAAPSPHPTGQSGRAGARQQPDARSGGGLSSFLRRHSVFGILLLTGVVLRLGAVIGYRPAFEFNGDSYAYIRLSRLSEPDPMRPAGYPAFLRVLVETGADLWIVPTVQHVLGVGLAIALYAFLVHRGVAAPLAALAAAPLLLDAYQVVIEHFVMAETLFAVLLVTAVIALMWSHRPSVWALAAAGLLLGASGLVRTIGVAIGLLALGYVLLRRLGPLRVVVFGVFLAAPLIAYASWFGTAHGKFGLTGGDAAWMYGRVAPIADCGRLDLKPEQLSLCSPHPVGERPDPSYYVWDRNSPANTLDVPADERDELLKDFTRQVMIKQPADYLRAVGTDIAHYFRPGRTVGPQDWPDATWRFPTSDEPRYLHTGEPLLGLHGESDHPARTVVEPWAGYLRSYQTRGFTPGPALAVAAGLGLLACLAALPRVVPAGLRGGDGRTRWHELTAERRRTGLDCLFLVAAGAAVIIVPAATVCFDYRYMLPMLFLLPPAAALATRQGQLLVVAWRERRAAAGTSWRTSPGSPDPSAEVADTAAPTGPASGPGNPGGADPFRTVDTSLEAFSAADPDLPTIPREVLGNETATSAPAPLPKRAPGVTFEARERRRRPEGEAGARETPTRANPRPARPPVILGPGARMPTPGNRPGVAGPGGQARDGAIASSPATAGPAPSGTAPSRAPQRGTAPGRRPPGGRTAAGGTGGSGPASRSARVAATKPAGRTFPDRGGPNGDQPNGDQPNGGPSNVDPAWDPPTMPPGPASSGSAVPPGPAGGSGG